MLKLIINTVKSRIKINDLHATYIQHIQIKGGEAAVGRFAPHVGVYGRYVACTLSILIVYLIMWTIDLIIYQMIRFMI